MTLIFFKIEEYFKGVLGTYEYNVYTWTYNSCDIKIFLEEVLLKYLALCYDNVTILL